MILVRRGRLLTLPYRLGPEKAKSSPSFRSQCQVGFGAAFFAKIFHSKAQDPRPKAQSPTQIVALLPDGLSRDLAGFLQVGQHFLGVAVGLDILKNVLN